MVVFIAYDLLALYTNFHENKYEYHILNIINNLEVKINKQINEREKILRIFALINVVLPQVNKDRKRVINIEFILRQIFRILLWNMNLFHFQNQRQH